LPVIMVFFFYTKLNPGSQTRLGCKYNWVRIGNLKRLLHFAPNTIWFRASFAMTKIYFITCHCEEQRDEAIPFLPRIADGGRSLWEKEDSDGNTPFFIGQCFCGLFLLLFSLLSLSSRRSTFAFRGVSLRNHFI
jgi:hypothetical protein